MKRIRVAGAVLISVGVLAMIVGHVSYTVRRALITVGPYQTPLTTQRVIPLRPVGALSMLGGIVLIVASKRIW